MKAIIVNEYGGPEVLNLTNLERPVPKDNEVLIKIKATAVTAASMAMREGKPYIGRLFMGLNKPKVQVPGTDLSGVVVEVGNQVTQFKKGDVVMAETGVECGTYAEYITLSEDELIVHQPEDVSAEEATGILDGACTALSFFTDSVQIKLGQKILINGASGSIGTAAVQLAKYFGAEVTGVCSTRNKSLVKDQGADMVVDYTKEDLTQLDERYDIIFDTVGKLSYSKCKHLLTENGVFLTPVISFSALLTMMFVSPFSKRKFKFAATGLRNMEERMRDLIKVRDLLASGDLETVIDRVYNIEEVQEAHSYVFKGHKRGNVILVME